MEPRIDYLRNGRVRLRQCLVSKNIWRNPGLDPKLMTLIKLRASQINCSGGLRPSSCFFLPGCSTAIFSHGSGGKREWADL
jgi:hypothetical protein